jgi:energy-coupling factor transporter ATP-binding protein EcfA2
MQIKSISTTAGFLKQAPIEFSPRLTCIIGARGTCKSTLVETLRFLFDCDPSRVRQLCIRPDTSVTSDSPSTKGLIAATLEGGIAKCIVSNEISDGTDSFSIEREVGTSPRLYRDGIEELVDKTILHNIEIYSQGDLQHIADDESLRLELIDRPNKTRIADLKHQQAQVAAELSVIGPELRTKAAEIETRRADIGGLEALKSRLATIQSQRPQLSAELDAERAAALRRKSLLETVQQALSERDRTIHAILSSLRSNVNFTALAIDLRSTPGDAAPKIADALDQFAAFADTVAKDAAGFQDNDLSSELTALTSDFERHNSRYNELRQEQQAVNDSLKQEDVLKQQIAHLEKLQNELEDFSRQRQELVQKRNDLRIRLQSISDEINRLRQHEVDRINEQHSDVVILTLDHGANSVEYAKHLVAILQGSRLRGQDDVARDLAVRVRPCDLVDIIEAADSQRLATLLQRDLGQMARLISFLMDKPELHQLEGVVFEDRLEITMYDRDAPKPVSQLSKGQKATALLPLILRPAPYPLLFDQPEDDLDNSFIFKTLIQQIQSLKQERQLIFVTHNANIPVLGEADRVIVMDMDTPELASAPIVGSVDDVKTHILNLLEGGLEAFRRREKKYHPLLAEGSQ